MLLTVLSFVFVLGIAILFHEFGHFIVAKLSGIKVYKFSIGFGPKLTGFFWKGTEYIICLFPFGGYIKMAGEDAHKTDENMIASDTDTSEEIIENERFDKKHFLTKIAVIINGPVMNIFLAIMLLSIVFFFSGTSQITNRISEVLPNSPAEKAGLISGDSIIAINFIEIKNAEDISKIIDENRGQDIFLKIMRENKTIEIKIQPQYNSEHDRAMIGITLEVLTKKISLIDSIKKSVVTAYEIITLIGKGFREMFSGNMPIELAGPLGIAQMAGEAAKAGFINLLFFSAIINIFLGFINLFPIPILDGGQILLIILEKIKGSPIKPEYINFLYMIGLAFIGMIFVLATYQDIKRIFIE